MSEQTAHPSVMDFTEIDLCCFHYPLKNEIVEALAQAAHDAYFDEVWEHQSEIDRALWCNVVRAVFDKLRSGDL